MTTMIDMSGFAGPFGLAPRCAAAPAPTGVGVCRGGHSFPPSQIPSSI